MLVESANPVHSLADSQRMREAVRAPELSDVIDVAKTETAAQGDFCLPASRPFRKAQATLLNLEFPHEELPVLYRSADCFLAVSRGEGWDMPLMEAMACGLPTIASDWSSHREFVHDRIAYRLAVERLIPAVAKCPYYAGFRWAQADEEHLRHLLRHVYEHPEEAAAKGAPPGSGKGSNGSAKVAFIPRDKVLPLDHFPPDELGEFPAKWSPLRGTVEGRGEGDGARAPRPDGAGDQRRQPR